MGRGWSRLVRAIPRACLGPLLHPRPWTAPRAFVCLLASAYLISPTRAPPCAFFVSVLIWTFRPSLSFFHPVLARFADTYPRVPLPDLPRRPYVIGKSVSVTFCSFRLLGFFLFSPVMDPVLPIPRYAISTHERVVFFRLLCQRFVFHLFQEWLLTSLSRNGCLLRNSLPQNWPRLWVMNPQAPQTCQPDGSLGFSPGRATYSPNSPCISILNKGFVFERSVPFVFFFFSMNGSNALFFPVFRRFYCFFERHAPCPFPGKGLRDPPPSLSDLSVLFGF